jgi:phosphoribosylanthranilate isomerase
MDVKICGAILGEEIDLLDQEGAGYVGLWTGIEGHRHNLTDTAFDTLARRCTQVRPLAVCVRRPVSEVAALMRAAGVGIVQLHGFNPPADVARLKAEGFTVVKTLHVDDAGTCLEARWIDHYAAAGCDVLLLDRFAGEQGIGSTGRSLSAAIVEAWVSRLDGARLWLAGGLTPDRVSQLSEDRRIEAADVDSAARHLGIISRKATRLLVTAAQPRHAYREIA